MKVDNDDIQLIRAIHKQYYSTEDEKVKNSLRYVLKDMLGRHLIQVKHYEPWVSEQAKKEINKKLPGIPLSRIRGIHDCNPKNHVSITREQKKLFANKNSYDKHFHLEHDPPTLQVIKSILDTESITDEEIKKKLKPYRLCFITVKENAELNKRGFRSRRPLDAYEQCGIKVNKAK